MRLSLLHPPHRGGEGLSSNPPSPRGEESFISGLVGGGGEAEHVLSDLGHSRRGRGSWDVDLSGNTAL